MDDEIGGPALEVDSCGDTCRRTTVISGDGVWNDPTSVERDIASVLNTMRCLKPLSGED